MEFEISVVFLGEKVWLAFRNMDLELIREVWVRNTNVRAISIEMVLRRGEDGYSISGGRTSDYYFKTHLYLIGVHINIFLSYSQ